MLAPFVPITTVAFLLVFLGGVVKPFSTGAQTPQGEYDSDELRSESLRELEGERDPPCLSTAETTGHPWELEK